MHDPASELFGLNAGRGSISLRPGDPRGHGPASLLQLPDLAPGGLEPAPNVGDLLAAIL